jgi:AmmeMemoRadiSam system protein B
MSADQPGTIRLPAVAGQFYTDNPTILRDQIKQFLLQATRDDSGTPKAIIAPHAGYIYSGPVAATAYKTLEPVSDTITRVVIMSPAHRYGFRGIAWSAADYFRTPLGDIKVSHNSIDNVKSLPFVNNIEQAFEGEHALEVHLPFLQSILHNFEIVPFIVGMAEPEQVAQVLETLWGQDETLIVISSDLSHFHDYQTARQHDRKTSLCIESLDYENIQGEDACGVYPLSGLLLAAQRKKLHVTLLDLRNSGDTAGSHDRVVGYGSFILN